MKIILWLSMQRSVLEICIGMLNSQEESKEYSISYSKLGSVDHQNRSRVFFQHLISKNRHMNFTGQFEISNENYRTFLSNIFNFGVIIIKNGIQKLAENHLTSLLLMIRNWIFLSRMRNLKILLCRSKL